MAFYVAVRLVAALVALDNEHHPPTVAIIWGTTIGLVLAHLFAFDLAARIVDGVSMNRALRSLASAQVLGAVSAAGIATIPALIFDASSDIDAARFVLSGFIAMAAFLLADSRGASLARSATFAGVVLFVATTIAVIKNTLLGH